MPLQKQQHFTRLHTDNLTFIQITFELKCQFVKMAETLSEKLQFIFFF